MSSKRVACDICGKNISSKSRLKIHKKAVHEGVRNHKCPHCEFTSFQFNPMRLHIIRKHGTEEEKLALRNHKCSQCSYRCESQSRLNIHIRNVHRGEKNHHCHLCKKNGTTKSFSTRSILLTHMELVHQVNAKQYSCDQCSYVSKRISTLNDHKISVHKNVRVKACPCCFYLGSDSNKLRIHIEQVHHTKIQTNICWVCGYKADSGKELNDHIGFEHEDEEEEREKEKEWKDEETPRMVCPFCPYWDRTRKKVIHHMFYNHIPKDRQEELREISVVENQEGSPMLSCPDCSFMTESRISLNKHIKNVHGSFNRYECKECGYKIYSHHKLQIHINSVHIGRRDFHCPHCPFESGTSSTLSQHIRKLHTDKDLYKCSLCDFSSKYIKPLKSHIKKTHHGENPQIVYLYLQGNPKRKKEEPPAPNDGEFSNIMGLMGPEHIPYLHSSRKRAPPSFYEEMNEEEQPASKRALFSSTFRV